MFEDIKLPNIINSNLPKQSFCYWILEVYKLIKIRDKPFLCFEFQIRADKMRLVGEIRLKLNEPCIMVLPIVIA